MQKSKTINQLSPPIQNESEKKAEIPVIVNSSIQTSDVIATKEKKEELESITSEILNKFYQVSQKSKNNILNYLLFLERLIQMTIYFLKKNPDAKLQFSPLDIVSFYIERVNKCAVDAFNNKDIATAKSEIQRVADLILDSDLQIVYKKAKSKLDEGKVLTYNNLSCIYRKIGDYDKAVKVLNLTISIEEKLALSNPISAISIISTYLNKSAILSENKQHKEALDAAKLAEINLNKIIKKYGPNTPEGAHLKYLELLTDYNMASEMEHLQQKDQATKKYELALELAKQLKRNDFIDQLEKILKKQNTV